MTRPNHRITESPSCEDLRTWHPEAPVPVSRSPGLPVPSRRHRQASPVGEDVPWMQSLRQVSGLDPNHSCHSTLVNIKIACTIVSFIQKKHHFQFFWASAPEFFDGQKLGTWIRSQKASKRPRPKRCARVWMGLYVYISYNIVYNGIYVYKIIYIYILYIISYIICIYTYMCAVVKTLVSCPYWEMAK